MMTFFGLFGHRNIVALLVAEQAVAGDVAIGKRLHALHDFRIALLAEQVCKALLQHQILLDGLLATDLGNIGHLTVFGFKDREQTGFVCKTREFNRLGRRSAPAKRARNENVDIARAVKTHCITHLAFQIVQIGHGGSCHVGNAVRHGDGGHVLALTETVAREIGRRHRRRRTGRRRRCRGTLHAGVHVGLVVKADIEHVVVALEHAREATEADVGGAAVTAQSKDADGFAALLASLDARGSGQTGRNGRRIAEKRMEPRQLPGAFGIRRGEDFQAARGVGSNDLAVGGGKGRVNCVACAECFAATLAGAVTGIQSVVTLLRRLNGTIRRVKEAIADRPGARLIKADC